MDSCLSGKQAPIRIKDKQYYKKLLDRYFGHNHALANENNSRSEKTMYRSKRTFPTSGLESREDLNRQFPHVRLSYSSNDRKVVLTHEPYILEGSDGEEVPIVEMEIERESSGHRIESQISTSMQPDRSVTSVMSSLSNTHAGSYCSNSDISQLTVLGGVPPQPSHYGSNSSVSSLSLSSQPSLHTHSNAHTTTNICLYPPPNPLAKPILPITTALTKIVPITNNTVSSQPQPSHGGRSWTHKTSGTPGGLASVNERTIPSYQRTKYIRKPLGTAGRVGGPGAVIPDSEYRNLSSLLETEAERNRILARNGFTTNVSVENRSDSITPTTTTKRVLSASGQRKDGFRAGYQSNPLWQYHLIGGQDLPRYPSQQGPGLSVVSGPAPVIQRPDLSHPDSILPPSTTGTISRVSSHHSTSNLSDASSNVSGLRSTRSQRIRGASNNIRLRQMEMRENHAAVFS